MNELDIIPKIFGVFASLIIIGIIIAIFFYLLSKN
jgi:hypothetical protein